MRNIVLCTVTLLLFSKSFSQKQDSIPKIIFGFDLGINYANTQLKNARSGGVRIANSTGFLVGVLMDCRLSKRFSLLIKPELSFNESQLKVWTSPDDQQAYQVYPTLLEFASHLNYKFSNRKTAPYFLAGPSYKVPLTGDKKIHYATMRNCFSIDFGIGLDKRLKYFNIAPELRYSLGITDLGDNHAVGNLYFNTVTLVLNFKG